MQSQNDPVQVLLDLYWSRPDLQEAYPEVSDNELQPLINWGASAAAGALEDSSRPTLQPYAAWYAQHAFEFRPAISWDTVTETCSLAANAQSITASVNSINADDDDISDHLPILSMLVTEFNFERDRGTWNAGRQLQPDSACGSEVNWRKGSEHGYTAVRTRIYSRAN